jgi:AcrR family transcriptional regulator
MTDARRRTRRRRNGGHETKERLMDIAETHLAKSGYMGVSLEEIAKEVGVSKPALYYHFPGGKEDLYVAIGHRSLRRLRIDLEREMSAHDDGAGKLRAVARWLMVERERGHPMSELRDVARFVDEGHRAELAESFHADHYTPIRRTIASAVESGEFRQDDPDFLTWAFLGLASGMLDVARVPASTYSAQPTDANVQETADRMVNLFLNGVLR